MARSQCDVNLSQLIALLGAQLCQCPNNVSGALVICCLPVQQAYSLLCVFWTASGLVREFFKELIYCLIPEMICNNLHNLVFD